MLKPGRHKGGSVSLLLLLILTFGFMGGKEGGENGQRKSPVDLSTIALTDGEAAVWYLYHSGWAVKTAGTFLVFDYWEVETPGGEASLSRGFIVPEEIKEQNVFVFVSHGHGDHFDETVMKWKEDIPGITYVFGWAFPGTEDHVVFSEQRTSKRIGPLTVANIHHAFDGIPESAWLIQVDGLTLYFSGDHGNSAGRLNPVYKDNIDFISSRVAGPDFDLVFLSIFGSPTYEGEFYALEKFGPEILVPMHFGDREPQAASFVNRAERKFPKLKFWYPLKRGDGFLYKDGKITPFEESPVL